MTIKCEFNSPIIIGEMTSSSTVLKEKTNRRDEYSTNSSMMAACGSFIVSTVLCQPHQELSKECNMSFSVLPLVFNKKYFMYNLQ